MKPNRLSRGVRLYYPDGDVRAFNTAQGLREVWDAVDYMVPVAVGTESGALAIHFAAISPGSEKARRAHKA